MARKKRIFSHAPLVPDCIRLSSTKATDGAFSTTIMLTFTLIFHVVELKIPALEMNDIYSNAAGYF